MGKDQVRTQGVGPRTPLGECRRYPDFPGEDTGIESPDRNGPVVHSLGKRQNPPGADANGMMQTLMLPALRPLRKFET